eukprot:1337564-Pleurochrysis_carterae.AAC.4
MTLSCACLASAPSCLHVLLWRLVLRFGKVRKQHIILAGAAASHLGLTSRLDTYGSPDTPVESRAYQMSAQLSSRRSGPVTRTIWNAIITGRPLRRHSINALPRRRRTSSLRGQRLRHQGPAVSAPASRLLHRSYGTTFGQKRFITSSQHEYFNNCDQLGKSKLLSLLIKLG